MAAKIVNIIRSRSSIIWFQTDETKLAGKRGVGTFSLLGVFI